MSDVTVKALQQFSDLNGIQRRAFADLVADDPEGESSLGKHEITPDASHQTVIAVGDIKRRRILRGLGGDIIDHMNAGR